MAIQRRHRFKNIENTGFGPNSSVEGGRLTNKDGTTNLRKIGIPIWERISIYHTLLRMKRGRFLMVVVLFYTCINFFFASIYFVLGVDHLDGAQSAHTLFDKFMEAFFFSSQTLTTVGYGHVAPIGISANSVASAESLVGILVFALVTGLMYGRFARPRAYIKFSHNVLVAPFREGRGLMLRIATYKNNYLTDVEAIVTVALHIQENGKYVTRFYQLPLQISKINSLALNWTIVHPMDEDSPLHDFTEKDFNDSRMELIVNIKAFDDHFSNIVQQRTSYTYQELIYGARFLPMFRKAEDNNGTILELDKINAHEKVTLEASQTNPAEPQTVDANA